MQRVIRVDPADRPVEETRAHHAIGFHYSGNPRRIARGRVGQHAAIRTTKVMRNPFQFSGGFHHEAATLSHRDDAVDLSPQHARVWPQVGHGPRLPVESFGSEIGGKE